MRISHEAIYRSLFVQTRGVLKKELMAQLRTRRQMRHAKGGKAKNGQGHILDMVSIRERPAEAEDRAVPGHWEGDLLTGANDTHIATLVERHSRFTMLVKLPRKDTTTVVATLAKHIRKLPEELRRSLTWDQGKEMSGHKRFTVATNVQVYFCDPRSPWQRGSNENTNGRCDSTSREEPISRASPRPTSTRSPCGSINARERPWVSKPQSIDCDWCCTDPLNSPG
jgi:transposase, IS30 family